MTRDRFSWLYIFLFSEISEFDFDNRPRFVCWIYTPSIGFFLNLLDLKSGQIIPFQLTNLTMFFHCNYGINFDGLSSDIENLLIELDNLIIGFQRGKGYWMGFTDLRYLLSTYASADILIRNWFPVFFSKVLQKFSDKKTTYKPRNF